MSRKVSSVDSLINRWFSKKLLAFGVATWLLYLHIITADQWYNITLLYIGFQSAYETITSWKHGPHSAQTGQAVNDIENKI